ncbi:hypothetical protein NT6N_23680 [Oceaniferula spumae]|uniref:CcmD family protein n=1 Tax=Oceaniferula spumae TaxID=2979115 RepID=A0AAT9FMX9_9BACT
MRQALLLFLTVFCVACVVAFQVINAYAERDVESISKLAASEHVSENRDRLAIRTERHKSLSDMRYDFGFYGWVVAIAALLYSLRLIRKYQLIEDQNETLRADLREKKIAEQVEASDR